MLISESGELRSIGFDQIRGIRILDAKLREDLDQYLDILQSTFHKNLRRLTISATGQGERDMFVSYVVEAPVWKTTYRLVIDSAAKPFLQGWALIDNLQDEDWNNVTLSLISGAPVSFIHDLQQPIYRSRPVIAMPENVSVAPQLAEPSMGPGVGGGVGIGRGGGIATGDGSDSPIKLVTPSRGGVIQGTIKDTSGAVIPNATIQVIQASTNARITVNSDSDGRYRVRGLPPGRYALNVENSGFHNARIEGINISAGSNINQNLELRVGSISEEVTVSSLMALPITDSASAAKIRNEDSGVDVNVDTQDIGELFEYRIAHPVSIKRNSSALIPILQNQVDGEMVSLYNRSVREQNPMNALYLKNNTGLTLESGPITIIENDTYAGEAMLSRIKPAEKRFVTYAVDLGCRISVKEDDEEERAFFSPDSQRRIQSSLQTIEINHLFSQ
ncbi:MAG: carboxypeptidase regulatory-like domain-containing protein [Acidobacteria bacterium]|nr:carboxypeptidase regulatory-like domain-containing protein [Acidobacteriota bacterium]